MPLFGLGMPAFWLGLILQTWLGVKVRLFPVTGYGQGFTGHLRSMFLPALTVAVALSPVLIRSLRASMLGVLGAEFITTARAKGVPTRRLLVRHVLRNAVIPAVTVLGINIGYLIGNTAHRGAGLRHSRHRRPDDPARSSTATSPSSSRSPSSTACWWSWSTCSPTWPTSRSTRE